MKCMYCGEDLDKHKRGSLIYGMKSIFCPDATGVFMISEPKRRGKPLRGKPTLKPISHDAYQRMPISRILRDGLTIKCYLCHKKISASEYVMHCGVCKICYGHVAQRYKETKEKTFKEKLKELIERFPTWKKNYIYSYHGCERWFKELKELVKND